MAGLFIIQKLALSQIFIVHAQTLQLPHPLTIPIPPGHSPTLHSQTPLLPLPAPPLKIHPTNLPHHSQRCLLLLQSHLQTFTQQVNQLHQHVCLTRLDRLLNMSFCLWPD